MKIPNWIKNAYMGTDVHWQQTQASIHKMLNEVGVYDIRFTAQRETCSLEFLISLDEGKPRAVRFTLKISPEEDEKKRTKALNVAHRLLINHLKAKFISIGRGLIEFEEEFMSNLVVTDSQGNSRTMGEMLLPQYRQGIENGSIKDFKLLG